MFLKAYCLLDQKTGIYSQPFFFVHNGLALRAATEMGYDQNTQVGRYPYDFRLVRVGEFDDSVGLLLSVAHEDLGTIGSLLASAQVRREPDVDLSEMTASEVINYHEATKAQ